MVKRILVFPCGSEIGLEIHRSMQYSSHFELVGASSFDDHGRFVYDDYIGNLPLHNAADFAQCLQNLIKEKRIDAIYPAMDAVADTLKQLESQLGVVVIGSSPDSTAICASKNKTYELLKDAVRLPTRYAHLNEVDRYPVFIKPDRGYGSRGTKLALNAEAAHQFLAQFDTQQMLLLEYLPGMEWTIDCFSNRYGELLFHGVRVRGRISNGISVYTKPSSDYSELFAQWANAINLRLRPRGAWFFQAKLDANQRPALLEVAARLGGSSSLFRCQGVNFAMLSAFDAFDLDVDVMPNSYGIELDRALDNRYKLQLDYEHVYVDLDDCLIVKGRVNVQMVGFLHHALNLDKKITLLTRHALDPSLTLQRHRISALFDEVIHLSSPDDSKASHIRHPHSIFIDDSYAERKAVMTACGIPTFSPDMVESLY